MEKHFDVVAKGEFIKVYLFYPKEWRKLIELDRKNTRFNWFLCSQRKLKDGYFVASVSPFAQFYCPFSGMMYSAKSNSQLLILSDPHNKKKLISKGLKICDSERDVLSTECELVRDPHEIYELASYAQKELGLDGVVVQHDCLDCEDKLIGSDCFLCNRVSFYFRDGTLQPTDKEKCGMLCYAKTNNSCIRETLPEFPTTLEIDKLLSQFSDDIVRAVIYEELEKYFNK